MKSSKKESSGRQMSKSEPLSKSSTKLSLINKKGQKQLSVDCPFLLSPIYSIIRNKMERIYFEPLLNSYATLAKEMDISSPEQIRERDIGVKVPKQIKSQRKIMEMLYRKREALDQLIQKCEALRGIEK